MVTATGLSREVVDAAHREEIAAALLEIRRLNATLDVLQVDRDTWRDDWRSVSDECQRLRGELERARDLAVRAGAFEPPRPARHRYYLGRFRRVTPDQDAVSRPADGSQSDEHGRVGWIGPSDEKRGSDFAFERERDDGR